MIDLGLARIGRLLQYGPPPAWKAVHVAGTNGKGSVCAYLSAMLHARGLPSARFTSPHIVDRWDCVVVNERVVAEASFRAAERAVRQRDRDDHVGATEFELLTATAFELFGRWSAGGALSPSSVSSSAVAVIECGLGGATDATTAMRADRAVTVITRIGLDHQGFLGSSVGDIALQKAGIMQAGVPCVVDPANGADPAIRRVLEARAQAVGATLVYPTLLSSAAAGAAPPLLARLEPHQLTNLAIAYAAFRIATGQDTRQEIESAFLANIVQQVRWPGRLQTVDVGPLLGSSAGSVPALLDGAHNAQSAAVLGAYVDKHLRGGDDANTPVTWILAASYGKDLDEILQPLLRPHDRVAAVRFGPVDGMPWVRPAEPRTILAGAAARGVASSNQHAPDSIVAALQWATTSTSAGGPLVIAGSLYLVSDTLRLLRAAGGDTGLPLTAD